MRSRLATVGIVCVLVLAGCTGAGGDAASYQAGGDGGAASGSVGAAVGGAQDAATFRRNVRQGFVPRPSAMTYEGLYHDYRFETGNSSCDRRFCPTSAARSRGTPSRTRRSGSSPSGSTPG